MFRNPWELDVLTHEHIEDLFATASSGNRQCSSSIESILFRHLRSGIGRGLIWAGERISGQTARRPVGLPVQTVTATRPL